MKYDLDTVAKAAQKLPIILESFEEESLLFFSNVTDLPLIQLMSPNSPTKYDLDHVSTFAHGVGPSANYLFNQTGEDFNLDKPSVFIEKCHQLDMNVHPYFVQDDFLVFTNNAVDENLVYWNKGVDGMFTEFPETTLHSYLMRQKQKETSPQFVKNIIKQ